MLVCNTQHKNTQTVGLVCMRRSSSHEAPQELMEGNADLVVFQWQGSMPRLWGSLAIGSEREEGTSAVCVQAGQASRLPGFRADLFWLCFGCHS